MHHSLGHRQGAGSDSNHQQQFALGVHRCPYPVGRALEALDRLVLAELTVFDVPQHGIQLIELQLLDVHITEEITRKGVQVLRRFHQPVQHRVRIDLKDPGGGPNA
jgi:hypothetical protein